MKAAIDKVREKIDSFGSEQCDRILLPAVKAWMKANSINKINFINGRSFCETIQGETWFPEDFPSVEVANELIELSNCIGYERGFDLPDTIQL